MTESKRVSAKKSKGSKVGLPRTRDANETRAQILLAARKRFSLEAYENVGVRAIAADVGVDPALVNRYFGSKENLFREVLEGAFLINEEEFEIENFADGVIDFILGDMKEDGDEEGRDDFQLFMRSAGSPVASAMVAIRFHEDFVVRLASYLKGKDTTLRATLIASYILGMATMKVSMNSAALKKSEMKKIFEYAGKAIQKCLDG